MKKKNLKYYLLGILLFCFLRIDAQSFLLEKAQEVYFLRDHLVLALDPSQSLTLDKIQRGNHPLTFKPLESWEESFEVEQTYWGKFQIENRLTEAELKTEWVLKYSLTLTDIEVYAIDNFGNIQKGKSGFFTPIKERDFAPVIRGNVTKINILPDRFYTVYLKMRCDRLAINPEFDISLTSAENYFFNLNKRKEHQYIYLGFVLMMLSYNLILYFFAKDKTFIFYSIYLLGVVVFTAYNSGDLASWLTQRFFPNTPQTIYYFKLIPYIGLSGYWTFMRSFLDLPKLLPTWDKIFKWLSIIAIPLMILDGAIMTHVNFSHNIADRVLISFLVAFVLSIFMIIPALVKTKDKKSYFIIFGIVAMGIGILLTIIARVQSLEFSTFYFKIGSILEIIAFSLGLAYRRLLEEKERQQAQFQLDKSKLIQEQEQKEAERLKELDTLKSRLYTNITHEFRTPLTVIMGMTKQIKDNEKTKSLIYRNSESLLQLINQMLDLAKAEDGKLKVELVHKDIIGYLRYLTESFSSATESNQIQLTFYSEIETLMMDFDEQKIHHIVQNLLSNAIKFTEQSGKIIVHVKKYTKGDLSFLQLKVKDTGIGIAEADLPHIFDRFYQSDDSGTRKVGGTGIGLSLTKELVHLMGGVIKAESEVGVGTELLVELPVRKRFATKFKVDEAVEEDRNNHIADDAIFNLSPTKEMVNQEVITGESEDKSNQPLLLIIEDNADVLTYIQTCLSESYSIQIARNGEEGIKKAYEIIPDIIISDVMMPYKDGFEVTETLKVDERTSHIPIILLTAKATQADKIKGLKYGADAYLMKPFDKEELIVRLEKLVELRSRLQERYNKIDFISKKSSTSIKNVETIFLKRLHEVIHEHLAQEDFSVPQIAHRLNMSQVQVYRKLKALTGQTPSKYIRAIRMKKAMELLTTTNLNISEIAYDLGFTDPNYFSRTFQQVYGKTPSSIRK